ncbi:MAG: MOSC domain-containing protein [Chloroflexi bacterium]|nr:MOSC domain-containing protein [Chloroflexota bacterium]
MTLNLDAINRQARIFQINLSDGGVPKLAVQQAELTVDGLLGDRQRDLEHHGGVERAVCLFSLEVILALQAEGHPIFAGAAGENLTLAGVRWVELAAGMRFRLGEGAQIELTRPTSPCNHLIPYFIGGEFSRISHKTHPGWSRWYARVLQPGVLRVGDVVAGS